MSAGEICAAGVREILECWFDGRPIREEYLIVDGGKLAGAGAHSYGNATGGSDEVARFALAEAARSRRAHLASGGSNAHA